ncbi:peptide-methionine (S)-S-oxide reductase MsrA [Arthrobacter rhombi]|uniref:Peptide methionine sulfoxide reductase MsrA n=1 Tax=Arthrobacter rhombi TaxID=71253 RepID=A0A1R4G792_9MICC|nr:peptide-methionine (S)-S-oxide reductase MsrA [Arthrobacter rhombi]SJM63882.1 Peptide methionine sulfoxide reductase MsrA [Arthrobacter rhombi]
MNEPLRALTMNVKSKSAIPTSETQFGPSDSAGLPDHGVHTFILGAGCFWCMDTIYRKTIGVSSVVSGYIGGHTPNPNYREVCSGTTGHAEAVAVTFDAAVVPADVILDMFFTGHNPTTLNRQGYDVGTQYRSAMFYTDVRQREFFEASLRRNQENWDDPIVTEIVPASYFHEAEPIHQDFYAMNPYEGYCQVIINPKLAKARKYYSQWLTE